MSGQCARCCCFGYRHGPSPWGCKQPVAEMLSELGLLKDLLRPPTVLRGAKETRRDQCRKEGPTVSQSVALATVDRQVFSIYPQAPGTRPIQAKTSTPEPPLPVR